MQVQSAKTSSKKGQEKDLMTSAHYMNTSATVHEIIQVNGAAKMQRSYLKGIGSVALEDDSSACRRVKILRRLEL